MLKWSDAIYVNGRSLKGVGAAFVNAYEEAVIKQLWTISQRRTGQLVLREVEQSGRKLEIRPAPSLLDAEANPKNAQHPWKVDPKDGLVCAVVADSVLEYSPGSLPPGFFMPVFIATHPFYRADDTLVHELFHKARMMQGILCVKTRTDAWDNDEEFYAIFVTNIYLSECYRDHQLRASHKPVFEVLKTNSADFHTKYQMEIFRLKQTMQPFFAALATIPCQFNPAREEVKHAKCMTQRVCV